jgi:IS5 family transposase
MKKQQSFTDLEYSMRKRKTKREEFLETMDAITPWDEIVAMIEPYYYKNHLGRRPRGIEVMFRMYLLATWFNLSDEAVEDAIYDSYAMRKFMGLDFTTESVPDATTLCKFRKLINDNSLGERYFAACREFLEEHGRIMHGGTIVDATLIDAPSSTKNAEGKRDPEMHQTKKGNQWFFGAKLHVGVDAGSGYIHTTIVTAANVHDGKVAHELIREDDQVVYGDSAYCAVGQHKEVQDDPHLSQVDYRTNRQKPYRKYAWDEGPGTYLAQKTGVPEVPRPQQGRVRLPRHQGHLWLPKDPLQGPRQAENPPGHSLRQRQLLHARDGEESRKNPELENGFALR